MEWSDIASIVFACVAMNHLGLISAIEKVLKRSLVIINCVRCFTFWCVLAYMAIMTRDVILSVAVSLFCAWIALWLELGMGMIDFIYNKVYEKIYPNSENDTPATDPDKGDSPGTVPEL